MDTDKMIWACLLHLGMNSWKDIPLNRAPADASRSFKVRCMADYLRTDETVWRSLTDALGKSGANMLIIDVAESVRLPSHPELAVKGTWSIEKFQKELARLRAMGLEVIPKMNFSTCHDSWLKDYQRMVSTEKYYQVCADVIRDVIDIFRVDGKPPRFFHLGYDEETPGHQRSFELAIVRQGELWWHDFLWFAKQVESKGVRPWIWSDYCWAEQLVLRGRVRRVQDVGVGPPARADVRGPREGRLRPGADWRELVERHELRRHGEVLPRELPRRAPQGFHDGVVAAHDPRRA